MRPAVPLLLLAACRGDGPSPASTPAATAPVVVVIAPAASATAEPLAPAARTRTSGPLVIAVPLPPREEGFADHCSPMGWSLDSAFIGCCYESGGESDPCEANGPSGVVAGAKQKIAKGLTPQSALWRFAGEIDVVWETVSSRGANGEEGAALRVGARVRGEAPSYPITLKGRAPWVPWIHPEFMAISPDGRYFGVIGHATGGEWMNDFPMAFLTTESLASHAYNDAGFARHKKGEYARAAELFAEAAALDPSARLPQYNLACAYARLGDARVREALGASVSRGAKETRERAQVDPDFDSVRNEPWFDAIIR